MVSHSTTYRVIYGDTDNMGLAYHANFFRWFEMGRTEMFRFLGMPYKTIEARGFFLPVAEAHCRFMSPVKYDDLITIETMLDTAVRGGVKFNYTIMTQNNSQVNARGYTRHAFLDGNGRVVRPPDFIQQIIKDKLT